jgi:hypothetical protein
MSRQQLLIDELKSFPKIQKTPFKLKLNGDTDTTTCCIIASSYAGGKTTLMMNNILPFFYGAKHKWDPAKGKYKDVYSQYVKRPDGKQKYICTLFSTNTQIPIYEGYPDLIKVTGFKQPQQELIKKMQDIQVDTKNEYRFVVMFDDVINVKHKPIVSDLFCLLRNSEISTVMCLQYLKMLPPDCRTNVANMVFGKLATDAAIKAVLDEYLSSYFSEMGYPKYLHNLLYKELTKDYCFIHLHQATNEIFFCEAIDPH